MKRIIFKLEYSLIYEELLFFKTEKYMGYF